MNSDLQTPIPQDLPHTHEDQSYISVADFIRKHGDILEITTNAISIAPILRGDKTAICTDITPAKGDLIHFKVNDPLEVHDADLLTTFFRSLWRVTYASISRSTGFWLVCFKPLKQCSYFSTQDSLNPSNPKEDCISFPVLNPPWIFTR